MDAKELESRIEDMKEAKFVLLNIQDGATIDRFKFTEKESLALAFVIEMIDVYLQE